MSREYYLDMAASTPVSESVLETIMDTMRNTWANPSSVHSKGVEAYNIIRQTKNTMAEYINCDPEEIVFTSGAAEANSLAILGYLRANPNTVFCTSNIEHKSILSMLEDCEMKEVFAVNSGGRIMLDELNYRLDDSLHYGYSSLVSIQAANSEIGVVQDIQGIAEVVHRHKGILHCDATQLFPYQRINVKKMGIDMMSISGQKIHAPKGIGFLYVRKGIKLKPLIYGTQSNGLRGGTENIPYIAGLGKAIEELGVKTSNSLCDLEVAYVRKYMEDRLLQKIDGCILNSYVKNKLSNLISISFKGIEAESLLLMLDINGIYVSSGSACNSGNTEPSYVLKAIQVPDEYIRGTIRITLPDDFTFDEADYVVEKIKSCVERLRKFAEK